MFEQAGAAVVAAWTKGSRDRLGNLLRENRIAAQPVDDFSGIAALPNGVVALAVLGLERGFLAPSSATGTRFGLSVVGEQDLLGERMPGRRAAASAPTSSSPRPPSIERGRPGGAPEHGIGRYDGLETLEVSGAPHDCLRLIYDGGDKLFVPVENIDVLSRYGSRDAGRRARQARRRRLAVAQGRAQAAHPRHGRSS